MNSCFFIGILLLGIDPVPTKAGPDLPPVINTTETVLTLETKLTLRVRQILTSDGLSSGERLLNSQAPLQVGDGFLAEVVECPAGQRLPANRLVAGRITSIRPPGHFGKPGVLTLELGQLVLAPNQHAWQVQVADQRYLSPKKRWLLSALVTLEGLGIGAAVGGQFQPVKSGYVLTGAAVGLVAGVALATLLPGRDATLDPGDTFSVVVGSVQAEQITPETVMKLYPSQLPGQRKGKP